MGKSVTRRPMNGARHSGLKPVTMDVGKFWNGRRTVSDRQGHVQAGARAMQARAQLGAMGGGLSRAGQMQHKGGEGKILSRGCEFQQEARGELQSRDRWVITCIYSLIYYPN